MNQDKKYNIVYRLFYWKKDNNYVFSRTKFITLLTFIIVFFSYVFSFDGVRALGNAIFIALIVFIIGFIIHKLDKIDSSFYGGNLLDDIKHFLFFWYDSNKFTFSKTKLITVGIIAIGLLYGIISFICGELSSNIVAGVFISLIFAIPVLLIGFIIHRRKTN
jgi:hypothetical protein